MNGLLRRCCVLPRYALFPREIFRRDEEDRRRRCRRHRRGGLTKYPAEKIRGTAGVVRELCGLAKGEIDAAWKSLSSGLGGLRARLDDEAAGGLDLPRPREVILHGVRACEGELPQIVVRHRQVRQHEVLHLLGREVFGEAQGVARLWKLLFLVGLLEPGRVLLLADHDLVHAGRRLPLLRQGGKLLGLHLALQPQPLESLSVLVARRAPGRFEFQSGPVLKRLRERVELLLRRLVRRVAAVGEVHRRELLAAPAAQELAEQREGGGDGLADEVAEDLPDHLAEPELRVVERALDREIEIDQAVLVPQERDREADRQLRRRLALDLVA